jgi:predicted TIM-barrel fold metal-dependent hydrolase
MFPPAASCDCHVHVIGPKARFPLPRERRYTPMDAPAEALQAMLKRLRLDRVVLVQPSFYGTDHSCMLDAMRKIPNARGVAVLPADAPESELAALNAQGVRGLRVNIATFGTRNLNEMREGIRAAAALCERQSWHVQTFIPADAIEPLAPLLLALPVPAVIDHFGLIAPGAEDGALRMLLELLHSGKVWVKISGAYRIAEDPNDPRIGPLARRLCAVNPERIVWGSDWPHTPKHNIHSGGSETELPFQPIDTAGLLDLVPRWLEDDALVQRVLVDNPAALYGF